MKYVLLILCCCFTGCKTTDVSEHHEWTASIDPSKRTTENEYDVIVIGGGMGGLSCGAICAEKGLKVLLLEQGSQVGGFCTSYSRNGFSFPVGAHDISGVESGAVNALLNILHLKKEDLFALHTRTYIFGEKSLIFTGKNNDFVEAMSKAFPDEHVAIQAFCDEAQKALNENESLQTWKTVSYQQKLDEYFQNKELKRVFQSLVGYAGESADSISADTALATCVQYFLNGGYYPKGGGKVLAEALKQTIETHNGTVLTDTKVNEILVENNRVIGVSTGSSSYLSSCVVANVNAKTTFLELLKPSSLPQPFIQAILDLKMSPSYVGVRFGVDLDLSSFSSIVKIYQEQGKKCSFVIDSNADRSMAPQGCSTISVGVFARYKDTPLSGTAEYKAFKDQRVAEALIKLKTVFPDIEKHILVTDVITPRTFERYTGMPEGAIYSFDQSKGSKRPFFKTPITGLYLASSSTYPGGGVEAVIASGLICAKDILQNTVVSIALPKPAVTETLS